MKIVRLAILVGVPLFTNGCCSTFCLIDKIDRDADAAKTQERSSSTPENRGGKP